MDDIANYILQDSPGCALGFLRDIRIKFGDIQRSPLIYQLRPDIGEDARMATVGSYAILFRVMGEIVRIERVAYIGRNLPDIFDQE
ncbi:type II toxin-antitoxin system RelE/ParE family toxin [Glaciimonas sp. PCH181]|uniref:type II toxin-antitoxin system RelE/ParE family toxin n=1 Tax=Glaciimonas sp. PCH181 TaxID=2133943 RepID=UPI00191C1E7D|nr:type II toxin-antitoxin system RelE/ParE family toxin [Glaciimonas sp. PCH181]